MDGERSDGASVRAAAGVPAPPPHRLRTIALFVVLGAGVIGLLSVILDGTIAVVLLDRSTETYTSAFPYPFTIQNLMLLLFFAGLGDAFVRWRTAAREQAFVGAGLLPEDYETVLQPSDLGPYRRRVDDLFDGDDGVLPGLINLCILQFQASRSVDQTVAVMNSSLDLVSQRTDLRYTFLRYVVWVVPTIGFIGTVLGIARALTGVAPDNPNLTQLTGDLGLAFNTTLVALMLSGILVLLLYTVQDREERSVNKAGEYCLRNLINRLYEGGR
jgi:hypothetical protein